MTNATKAAVWAVLILAPGAAYAQHPPIQSPQDAACRTEAGRRVFSEPNPAGVGLYTLGRQYWTECMRRSQRPQRDAKH